MDWAKENAYTKEVSCKMKYVYKNVHHFNHLLENIKYDGVTYPGITLLKS